MMHAIAFFKTFRCCTAAVMVALSAVSACADPGEQIKAGLAYLDNGQFEEAYTAFRAGRIEAQDADNKLLVGRLQFYLGLTRQEQVQEKKIPVGRNAEDVLEEARDHYRDAMSVLPASGGLLNNLAQVHAELGDKDDASFLFQAAIKIADRRQPLYLVNYGDFLAKEQPQDAAIFYQLALHQQPSNERAIDALTELYRDDPKALSKFLMMLFRQGLYTPAQEIALECLLDETRAGVIDDLQITLLTCVARCLSHQCYAPDQLSDKQYSATNGLLKKLEAIEVSADVKPVTELIRLYKGEQLEQHSYRWWSQALLPDGKPPQWGWPIDAFCDVARSLGKWYEEHEDGEKAVAYYKLAYGLNRRHLDPKSIVDLADYYIRTGQQGQLLSFLNNEEPKIFAGKNDDIRNWRRDRAFEFHRALGIVYSHLKIWKSDSNPGGAVYQLTQALDYVVSTNKQLRESGLSGDLIIEPRLVNLLAVAYEKTHRPNKALKLRLDNTDYFRELNQPDAAAAVFENILKESVPAEDEGHFNNLDSVYRDGRFLRADWMQLHNHGKVLRIDEIGTALILDVPDDSLSNRETTVLQDVLGKLFEQERETKLQPERVRLLPKDFAHFLLSVEFDGRRGTVVLAADEPGKIPFFVEPADTQPESAPSKYPAFRYIRGR